MIGAPVSSVRTPPLLEAYLAERGVAASIEVRHVEPAELDGLLRDLVDKEPCDGLLVTMPHKAAVARRLAGVSAVARAAGSVNAVKRLGQRGAGEIRLVGAQFDGVALLRALEAKAVPLRSLRVLLLGVGGAGRPIAQSLAAHGCAELAVADRDPARLESLAGSLRQSAGCPLRVPAAPFQERYDLLINATPLGMAQDDPSPFPESLVSAARFVADIVAEPKQTRLWALAEQSGAGRVSGLDMVRGQITPIGDWLLSDSPEQ